MVVYETALLIVGVSIPGAVVLPRLLGDGPASFPLTNALGGEVIFTHPTANLGEMAPDSRKSHV